MPFPKSLQSAAHNSPVHLSSSLQHQYRLSRLLSEGQDKAADFKCPTLRDAQNKKLFIQKI